MKSKIIKLFIPNSFRTRVILLTIFASFFTLLVTITLSYSYSKRFLTETVNNSIKQNVSILNIKLGEAIIYKDIYTMFTIVESIQKSSNYLKNVYLFDKDMNYITDALAFKQYPEKVNKTNLIRFPITIGDNQGVVGYIIYEINPDYIVEVAIKDSLKIGVTEILTFIFLLIVVIFFTNLLITPMQALNEYVQKMDLTNLTEDIKLPWYSSREVRDIAKNLTDISKRLADAIDKNMEQEKKIMANSKMASIGMMSSGLAHELKNPAMTVLLLAQTLAKELDERYSKDTEYLIRETNKIVKIVNDFLEIAKPISIKKSDVKVSEIQKVLEDYVYINYSNKLELLFINNIQNDSIFTDAEKVIEILINLLNNSFEAAATSIEIVFDEQDSYVLIGFRDNGCGIDEQNIDKIFLPFYTTKKTGTGLGLFYIESIINALNGSINVSSNDYGTTFLIRLVKE